MQSVRDCAKTVLARFPTLDVLINNAGIFHMGVSERRTTRDGYEEHVQVSTSSFDAHLAVDCYQRVMLLGL
jgi:NAD(P)-dependent dehydrogenase (short-subunit alcohol dehydrogenase family)